ncbi:hypothetical protein [Sediminibacter sp. Hel_I_10]|nr:hypothetical protein [Sediminibacter sp. Hel_I_10]
MDNIKTWLFADISKSVQIKRVIAIVAVLGIIAVSVGTTFLGGSKVK